MSRIALIIVTLLALLSPAISDHWAVLVAGSNSWENYRHQSDICHSYQELHDHGIPDQNIIVMMYDDIAFNPANPYPGNIINEPDGVNVYPAVPHDYTGSDVTVANFLAVLAGNYTATLGKKVLQSTKDDDVFIYFSDHGGPSIFAFPTEYLYSYQLMDALYQLYSQNRYRQLVIYMEACESGSMFFNQTVNNLTLADMRIYATTAANPEEPSWACYYDDVRETYLGDVYSVNWLENSDVANMSAETLHAQYEIVRSETNTSHVSQYGDLSISSDLLKRFQARKGYKLSSRSTVHSHRNTIRSDRVHVSLYLRALEYEFNQPLDKIGYNLVLDLLDKVNLEILSIFFARVDNPSFSSSSIPFPDVIRSDRVTISTYLRSLEKALNHSLTDIDFVRVSDLTINIHHEIVKMILAGADLTESEYRSYTPGRVVDSHKVQRYIESHPCSLDQYDIELLKYRDIYVN